MFYLIIVGIIFAVDYQLKKYVEEKWNDGEAEEICDGKIIRRRLSNYGSAGGFFADKSETLRAVISVLMGCLGIHFLILLFQKGRHFTKLAYALILGGGLSNLTDRYQKGYVTDYFSFNVKWKRLKQLVFNLSDLFILLGCAILVLTGLKKK